MDAIYQPVIGKVVDLVRTQVLEVQDKTSKLPKVCLHALSRIVLKTKS
jgi:hypothetical protein